MVIPNNKVENIIRLAKGPESIERLIDYMRGLTYYEILVVEALMLYGRDIDTYGIDDAGSLASWWEYVQDEWGGDKGDADGAITYIVGKGWCLPDYLEAAMNAL